MFIIFEEVEFLILIGDFFDVIFFIEEVFYNKFWSV